MHSKGSLQRPDDVQASPRFPPAVQVRPQVAPLHDRRSSTQSPVLKHAALALALGRVTSRQAVKSAESPTLSQATPVNCARQAWARAASNVDAPRAMERSVVEALAEGVRPTFAT
jgi:hypothetical protein